MSKDTVLKKKEQLRTEFRKAIRLTMSPPSSLTTGQLLGGPCMGFQGSENLGNGGTGKKGNN